MATNPTDVEKILILRINNAHTDAEVLDLIRAHTAAENSELRELIVEARMYVEDVARSYYDEDPAGDGARETLILMKQVKT